MLSFLLFQFTWCQMFNTESVWYYWTHTWDVLPSQLLTPSVLICRLINAHQHLLGLRISEYLGMNQVSWVFYHIYYCIMISFSVLNLNIFLLSRFVSLRRMLISSFFILGCWDLTIKLSIYIYSDIDVVEYEKVKISWWCGDLWHWICRNCTIN